MANDEDNADVTEPEAAAPPTPTIRRIPPNRLRFGVIVCEGNSAAGRFVSFEKSKDDANDAAIKLDLSDDEFAFVVEITGERV